MHNTDARNMTMMKSQRILVALLLASSLLTVNSKGIRALQQNEFSTRIVGGKIADSQRYPYAQVSLQGFLGHSCGGSVLAPDVIMTAAHCASNFDKVVVGVYNLSDVSGAVEQFGVQQEYVHNRYSEITTTYDVMLVKLSGNITVVDPVRINDNRKVPFLSEVLSVVGWGATAMTGRYEDYPELLHEVDLSYIPNGICQAIVNEDGLSLGPWLADDMMCAGDDGKDSCFGDSGGPLVKLGANPSEDVQIGIVSWGLDCAGTIPGIYHRTSHSYRWIQTTVCEISDSPPDYFKCNTEAPTSAPSAMPTVTPPTAMPTVPPTSTLTDASTLMDVGHAANTTQMMSSAVLPSLGYAATLLVVISAVL